MVLGPSVTKTHDYIRNPSKNPNYKEKTQEEKKIDPVKIRMVIFLLKKIILKLRKIMKALYNFKAIFNSLYLVQS
ncbi:hypothetical protein EGY05_10615 [Chryseobacterium arthrosphaerae]|nr:hypothetical protein EGY05_10615 [Chryseobacterium arthrosphaerae]